MHLLVCARFGARGYNHKEGLKGSRVAIQSMCVLAYAGLHMCVLAHVYMYLLAHFHEHMGIGLHISS